MLLLPQHTWNMDLCDVLTQPGRHMRGQVSCRLCVHLTGAAFLSLMGAPSRVCYAFAILIGLSNSVEQCA